MSRIFDALRKSENPLEQETVVTPSTFIENMEKARAGLEQLRVERARIRPESRIVVYTEPRSLGAERFRLLRARLSDWQAARKIKIVLVTSALPQDGKSLAAVNLASVLAGSQGRNVLLLEGDLRRAALSSLLGLTPWPGLTNCLQDGVDPMTAIRRIEPLGFYLLPAGQSPANPVELLQSPAFAEAMQDFNSCFEWILIDSPPVSPLADTPVLRTHADATLMVVRAGVTPRDVFEEAVKAIGVEHVIAVLLNGADGLDRSYYRYYYSYGENGSGKKDRGTKE